VWDLVAGVWGFSQRVIGGFAKWDVPDLVWVMVASFVRNGTNFLFQVVQLLSIYENFLILGFCFYFLIFSYFAKAGIFLLFLKLLVCKTQVFLCYAQYLWDCFLFLRV
jgi:hypothetical protein